MKLHQKLFLLLVLLLPAQLGRHFWPNWSYVLGLRIDYLSPTIYLTDILVFLVLFFWLLESLPVNLLRVTCYEFRKRWWILAFFIFLLVNTLLAQNSGAALYKFFRILEFSLLGFYVAKNKIKISLIHFPLTIAVVYSSLIAISQFIKQSSLNGIFWFLGERTFSAATPGIAKAVVAGRLLLRPYATFSHPNALAGFILVSLILTVPFIFKKSKIMAVGYLLLVVSTLVLTFSRAAWLVGLLIIGLTFLGRKKILLVTYCLLLVIGFIIFSFRFPSDEAIVQRLWLTNISRRLFNQHPLSGVGLNNFISQLPHFWTNPNPIYLLQPVHNIYLLILAETGITGFLIFLFLIFKAWKSPFKIALLAILLTGLFDHYWLTLQQNQLLFAIVLGLCWRVEKKKI
jgi:hypothetical protein